MNSRVYDSQLIPVAGASVSISAQVIEGGVFHAYYELLETVETDQDGYFFFATKNKAFVKFRFAISKANYYSATYEADAKEVEVGTTYTDTYEVQPAGWLKINVHTNSADVTKVRAFTTNPTCKPCCESVDRFYYGNNQDITTNCKTVGNEKYTVKGWFIDNGDTTTFDKSIFCTAFDTTTVVISY